MSMLDPILLPFCDVLMTERWDAPAGRYFAAFRARHGFRWHYDITPYAALLTVRNAGAAETQVVSARLRRWLRPAYYPLAWAPAVSFLPYWHSPG